MFRKLPLGLGSGIALVMGLATSALAIPISSCPFAITSGGTYALTQNLDALGDCITITVPDGTSVTVNLNGFNITGDGTGDAISAPPGRKVSVVGPGTISAFDTAVALGATTDVTVKRLMISDAVVGINVGQGSVYDSVVTIVAAGVIVGDSSLVKNVIVAEATAIGIQVGSGSSVVQSTANQNRAGISAGSGAKVKSSTANLNETFGIKIGPGGTVEESTANGNGALVSPAPRVGIVGDVRANINSNTANDNFVGIATPCPATVQQNTAKNNLIADIITSGSGCTVKKNVTTGP